MTSKTNIISEPNAVKTSQTPQDRTFSNGQFLVGFGSADITPDLGMPLFTYEISKIHGRVLAKVIYLEEVGGEGPVILAMGDVTSFDGAGERQVREAVSRATGVSTDRIRLNASHNHSCSGFERDVHFSR